MTGKTVHATSRHVSSGRPTKHSTMRRRATAVVALVAMLAPVLASARADLVSSALSTGTQHGAVSFPRDEHGHGDGLDYWWGAGDLVTTSGNHYTVAFAWTSFFGYAVTGHQLFAHQGPYVGKSILTADGPAEWGHPEALPGQYVRTVSSYVPGVSELLTLDTLDTGDGLRSIGRFERKSLTDQTYALRLDNDAAEVHPDGTRVRLGVDLDLEMNDGAPLLAGGTGEWWYGIPETFGYPSRSFQYMQAARAVQGTLELEQPDGTILHEQIVPGASKFVTVHEYDATPEDIPGGFAVAQTTQMHPRFAQYYQGGMPWELFFVDLGEGRQLMIVVLAFHSTEQGTVSDIVGPDQPTYRVLATLRFPDGRSVALDDDLQIEHLSYREIVGRVPTAFVAVQGHWIQARDFRVSHPGGQDTAGDGSTVTIPPFDLGLEPQLGAEMPALDDDGNGLTQRVPFTARGHFGGCPVDGFGWSELIINWHGRTHLDPWFTGGELPAVPASCGSDAVEGTAGNGRPFTPSFEGPTPPDLRGEGCQAYNPGPSTCSYVATMANGIGGYASAPGGWRVTISRPGRPTPIVVNGFSGYTVYACGIIRAGDTVTATAAPGSGVMPGNPGLCF